MKRLLALLSAAAVVASLAACSVFSVNTDPYGSETQQTPSLSPTKTVAPSPTASLTPTATPSPDPTPSPALSPTIPPEQAEALKKYEKLLGYCKDYLDLSAAAEIKGMYDEGKVSKAQFEALYDVWGDMKDYDEEQWTTVQDEMRMMGDIINARLKQLDEADGENFYGTICTLPQQGAAYINLFDTQQKQDRVKAAVDLVNKWYAQPTDVNFGEVNKAYYSPDLTPGEVLMLGYYIYYGKGMPARITVDGKSTDALEYVSRQGYLERADNAYYELIDMING